ncbi:hypothetical protein CEXT_40401 [Caerostris extrusa]|uniref:Uncharacterized protein n=1 Tax=Caerostris extrusa TaxID=172846 RepID=A0AAV4Y7F9_CAEEX|nr:hypothetical protein CEXT_40401 [Caerostris extrusa]
MINPRVATGDVTLPCHLISLMLLALGSADRLWQRTWRDGCKERIVNHTFSFLLSNFIISTGIDKKRLDDIQQMFRGDRRKEKDLGIARTRQYGVGIDVTLNAIRTMIGGAPQVLLSSHSQKERATSALLHNGEKSIGLRLRCRKKYGYIFAGLRLHSVYVYTDIDADIN